MPPIRFVTVADNEIHFEDCRNLRKDLLATDIPSGNNTVAKVEDYINNTWIPANVSGYQMLVHVISRNPLRVAVGTWNIGMTIPPNWWVFNA